METLKLIYDPQQPSGKVLPYIELAINTIIEDLVKGNAHPITSKAELISLFKSDRLWKAEELLKGLYDSINAEEDLQVSNELFDAIYKVKQFLEQAPKEDTNIKPLK